MQEVKKVKINNKIRSTNTDRVVLTINFILLTGFFIIIAYPLLYVILASFSGGGSTLSVNIIPERWTLAGYRAVRDKEIFWVSFRNSIFYTAVATVLSVSVTMLCAYPLSCPYFKGRKFIMVLCTVTMYFGGGLIPTYLNITNLHLVDTVWAITLPGAMSVYNMIVMRTFFSNTIPGELREAADLDGCGDFRYFISIVIPLSGAIIAVISLFVAVGSWNDYFNPMLYLNTRSKAALPVILRELLVVNVTGEANKAVTEEDMERVFELMEQQNLMKYSVIVVASLPVMIIYPFVQKFFVKGVTLGSVKG